MTLSAGLGSTALGAWTIAVTYDPQAVTVVDCVGLAGSLRNAAYAPGVVRVSGASAGGLSGRQTLATLTVESLGRGRAAGALQLTPVTLTNPAGVSVAPHAP